MVLAYHRYVLTVNNPVKRFVFTQANIRTEKGCLCAVAIDKENIVVYQPHINCVYELTLCLSLLWSLASTRCVC